MQDMQDMAEEQAKVANANYIATRHWEAVVESRRLGAQVSYLSGSCMFSPFSSLPSTHEVVIFAGF